MGKQRLTEVGSHKNEFLLFFFSLAPGVELMTGSPKNEQGTIHRKKKINQKKRVANISLRSDLQS